jgi:hypothetical protein
MRNCEDQSGGSTEAAGFQSKRSVTKMILIYN